MTQLLTDPESPKVRGSRPYGKELVGLANGYRVYA